MALDNFIPKNTVKECNRCKHHILGTVTCKAFPNRIPDEILAGRSHTKPFPGDNGIQFEEKG